ncbi:alpha/beta hydrolase [Nocardioides seonyuensis]|nr:alpha/beta fold hydrolase [Nocardioides seonyuensis]
MTDSDVTRYDTTGRPRAVIVMLHGGKPHSTLAADRRSASWLRSASMARTLAGPAREAGASVWLVRYRERGWNGGADRREDAVAALDQVVTEHGEVPVALLGHSMGARVAVHVADHPSVVGVVGLAPWWSAADPVHTVRGKTVVGAHGRHDRITSFDQTVAYLDRARPVAAEVALHDMGPLGHYMLTGVREWNRVALESSLAMVGGLRA